jgi:hypothetical protein
VAESRVDDGNYMTFTSDDLQVDGHPLPNHP